MASYKEIQFLQILNSYRLDRVYAIYTHVEERPFQGRVMTNEDGLQPPWSSLERSNREGPSFLGHHQFTIFDLNTTHVVWQL